MNYFIIGHHNWLASMEVKKEPYGKPPIIENTPLEDSKSLSIDITQHVQKMLLDVPMDLRGLFMPTTEEDLIQLELHLARFGKTQEDRERVRHLQIQFGLLFKPNMSLSETIVRVKIAILKRARSKHLNPSYMDDDLDEVGSF